MTLMNGSNFMNKTTLLCFLWNKQVNLVCAELELNIYFNSTTFGDSNL